MPRRFALSDLVERCKQRCDMENQESISDTEWKRMISTSWAELYSLVAETGLRYFETEETITTTGAASYDEPESHLSTVGVDYVVNAQGERRALYELMAQERNVFGGYSASEAIAYALIDDQIYLYPTPPAGQTYKWLYIPQPIDLSNADDATVVDVVTPDGEAFVLWGVAVQALAKEESDTNLARAERELARERVQNWAVLRALHAPRRRVTEGDNVYVDAADYWGRGGTGWGPPW